MSLQVLIADDSEQARTWLRFMLEAQGYSVCEAPDGLAAVVLARATHPDLALLDLAMPGVDGIDAGQAIHESCPETRLVLVTGHSQARQIVSALRAGFLGYVVKSDAPDGVLRAIREVRAGRLFLSPAASQAVIQTCLADLVPALPR